MNDDFKEFLKGFLSGVVIGLIVCYVNSLLIGML